MADLEADAEPESGRLFPGPRPETAVAGLLSEERARRGGIVKREGGSSDVKEGRYDGRRKRDEAESVWLVDCDAALRENRIPQLRMFSLCSVQLNISPELRVMVHESRPAMPVLRRKDDGHKR